MKSISIIIPALNEEQGIGGVIQGIPVAELRTLGYSTEVLVIDNGSTDDTARIARMNNATVIIQPLRGYGNAYKAGFAHASGDIIATGDADLTYPFSILPATLKRMEQENLDFINTDRLTHLKPGVMSLSHLFGNRLLTILCRIIFKWPFIDSQSGMWIFRRSIWNKLHVTSSGMPFSQELKLEAFLKGLRCAEIPIDYQARAGMEKLNTVRDGLGNILHIFRKRFL